MKTITTMLRSLLPAGLLSLAGCAVLFVLFAATLLNVFSQVGCEQCFGANLGLLLVTNGTEGRETNPSESESPGLPPSEEIDQEPDDPAYLAEISQFCDFLLDALELDLEGPPSQAQTIVQLRSGGIAVSAPQAPSARLHGEAPSPFVPTVYMTNSMDDTVLVVDPGPRTLLASVRVGERPRGVALTPDNATLFVANEDSRNVSVIDAGNLTETTRIPLPGLAEPYDVAITPDGAEVWVTSHEAPGFVHVIDAATLAVADSIRVGRRPVQVAISPDGTLAYVTNEEDNRLSVLDVWTHTVQRSVTVPSPYGVEFDPTGARVYVSSHSVPGTVRMIDVASDAVLATWEVGTKPEYLALDPFATRLFVTNRLSPFISAINLLSGEVEREIPAPRGLGPLAFAPN